MHTYTRAHTNKHPLSLSLLARSFTHLLLPTHSPTYNYLFTFVDIPLEPFLAKLASNIANARLPKPACIPSSVWSWSSRESRRRGGYSIDNYRIGEIWCTETQREHKCESSWYQHHRKVMRKESAWVGVEVGVGWGGVWDRVIKKPVFLSIISDTVSRQTIIADVIDTRAWWNAFVGMHTYIHT